MDSALVDKNPAPKSLTCHFCWKKNMEGHGLVAVRQLFHYVAHHPQRCLAWHRNWHECQGGRFGGPVVWKFAFEFVRSMRSVFVLFQSLKEVIQIPDLPVPCIYIYLYIHLEPVAPSCQKKHRVTMDPWFQQIGRWGNYCRPGGFRIPFVHPRKKIRRIANSQGLVETFKKVVVFFKKTLPPIMTVQLKNGCISSSLKPFKCPAIFHWTIDYGRKTSSEISELSWRFQQCMVYWMSILLQGSFNWT